MYKRQGTEGHPGYAFTDWMKGYALPEHLLQWPLDVYKRQTLGGAEAVSEKIAAPEEAEALRAACRCV